MRYLIRKNKAKTKHFWTGLDTLCRLYSTGGMNKHKFDIVDECSLPLCRMCYNKSTARIAKGRP